jgi:hypothetical protein
LGVLKQARFFVFFVIPAEAGIHIFAPLFSQGQVWIPVFTGMTNTKRKGIIRRDYSGTPKKKNSTD